MTTTRPQCPACRNDMQRGFIVDHGHANAAQVAQWVEGEPVERKMLGLPFGIDLRQRVSFRICSYRCPSCGLLQDFAPKA